MRIAVTGAAGMLGRAVTAAAEGLGHDVDGFDIAGGGHEVLDITDERATREALAEVGPDVVINCAAYTNVDGAESDEERALLLNGTAAGIVGRAGAAAGAKVVHLSTDYVFDGTKTEPYVESDPTGPQSAYGRTKLAGEHALAEANPNHAIVRTAWLYGAGGPNFVDTMLRLAGERDEVSVVTDQVGCPTWTGHLADALLAIAERPDTGLFHCVGAGTCSWYDFAVEIFARAGVSCRVRPTTSEAFSRPARRPAYSVMVSERPEAPVLPPWQDALAAYLEERMAA
jgi:dTDP-4-dehydrorhamnose reductase